MNRFEFDAIDDQGRRIRDTIEAVNEIRAQQLLRDRGLTVLSLIMVESVELPRPERDLVDHAPATEFDVPMRAMAEIARAGVSGLPPQPALRALAAELPSDSMRRRILSVCRRLDAGEPLDQAVAALSRGRHAYLPALIEAGVRNGQLPFVLSQLLRLSAQNRQLNRGLWFSLGYALVLVAAALGVSVVLLGWFVPEFRIIFEDFGVELPWVTVTVLQLSYVVQNFALPVGLSVFAVLGGIWLLLELMRRNLPGFEAVNVTMRRVLHQIPLLGSIAQYASMSRFCALLSMLITTKVPLPEALRLAGAGSADANLAMHSRTLARECEAGESLVDTTRRLSHFPRELTHLFRWERQEGAFRTALEASSELFAARANVQVGIASIFVEPLLLVVAGGTVGLLVISMFLPLIKLLNDLS